VAEKESDGAASCAPETSRRQIAGVSFGQQGLARLRRDLQWHKPGKGESWNSRRPKSPQKWTARPNREGEAQGQQANGRAVPAHGNTTTRTKAKLCAVNVWTRHK